MVQNHNIEYETRKHGQLFCINSSKDIVEMLLKECEKNKVNIITNAVTSIIEYHEDKKFYKLNTKIENKKDSYSIEFSSSSLIVATGALSVPSLGGSGFGYDIAKQFNLEVTELQAGLVPFMFSDSTKDFCASLSGVSHKVNASCNNKTFSEDILFTHRGLSGPVMLQISNYWKLGDSLKINLLPEKIASDYIKEIKTNNPKQLLKSILKSSGEKYKKLRDKK